MYIQIKTKEGEKEGLDIKIIKIDNISGLDLRRAILERSRAVSISL